MFSSSAFYCSSALSLFILNLFNLRGFSLFSVLSLQIDVLCFIVIDMLYLYVLCMEIFLWIGFCWLFVGLFSFSCRLLDFEIVLCTLVHFLFEFLKMCSFVPKLFFANLGSSFDLGQI